MTREELRELIDALTDEELLPAEMYLQSIIHRRAHATADGAMLQHFGTRVREFEADVDRRWHETKKSGYVSGLSGGGGLGFDRLGRVHGEYAFQYSDGDAAVTEKLRVFANQELRSIERLSIADGGAALRYEQELAGGGRTVRLEESFSVK
jgi:hypothetical protein